MIIHALQNTLRVRSGTLLRVHKHTVTENTAMSTPDRWVAMCAVRANIRDEVCQVNEKEKALCSVRRY